VNPLWCDLVNCFDAGIFFSIVHHDYDSRSVDGPKVTAAQLQGGHQHFDQFFYLGGCAFGLSMCVASHSLYPESLPSLSCNKSASIDSTRTYVSEFRRKLTFHRFHDPVFRLHQVVVLMENDSDALTSDKLRHKACAVPTKLDINNTQVYLIPTNGRRYPRISSDSYSCQNT
jgi:hypothetical protein